MVLFTLLLVFALLYGHFRKTDYPFDLKHTLPLRGLLAMTVVLCHLADPYASRNIFSIEFGSMGAPSVAAFFFMSGYGLVLSVKSKGGAYLEGFFGKRMLKIVLPLMVCSVAYLLLCYANEAPLGKCFERILHGGSIIPLAWFMHALVVCYLIFWLSFTVFRDYKKALGSLCVLSIALLVFTHVAGWGLWRWSLLGFPLGTAFVEMGGVKRYVSISSVVCVYAVVSLYAHPLPGWYALYVNLFPLLCVCVVSRFDLSRSVVLNWLGKYSMEIYLVHGVMLYAAECMGVTVAWCATVIMSTLAIAPLLHVFDEWVLRNIKLGK